MTDGGGGAKVAIAVAIIGVVGTLGAALFANWDKILKGNPPTGSILAGTNQPTPSASTHATPPGSPPAAVASDNVIEVWFAGSPHRGEMPSTTVSTRIIDTARALGYSINARGLLATEFQPELLKAVAAGSPPDVIFVDNYMHIEGGTTPLGTFKGMKSDAALGSRLLRVREALDDLGRGWSFLIKGSPDHDGAEALVSELSGCAASMETPSEEKLRTLQLQAEASARGFLQCSLDPAKDDRASLSRRCEKAQITARRVTVCRITAAAKLALVETAAATLGQSEIGRHSIVSVHRFDDSWRLLAISGDPVTLGATATQWRSLASRFGPSSTPPTAAALQTPDGVLPSPPAGARFGDFTWIPGKGGMAQIVEMNYESDTRLFLLDQAANRLSTGQLWTTNSTWHWRVWTVGQDGSIAFSESRAFRQH